MANKLNADKSAKKHLNIINLIDKVVAFLAFVTLFTLAAYGFRSILKAAPDQIAMAATVVFIGALVYIIAKNR